MPHAHWPLSNHLPTIDILLAWPNGQKMPRRLLADTGAGPANAPFELILDESDCMLSGGNVTGSVSLGGAYAGAYPVYLVVIEIPALAFAASVNDVGVPTVPPRLDG